MDMAELYKQLDAVVEAKTFSLDATKAIQSLKTEHNRALLKVEMLEGRDEANKERVTHLMELVNKCNKTIEIWATREVELVKREKAITDRELHAADLQGRSVAYENVFGLLFRNSVVRETFQKNTVRHAMEGQPGMPNSFESERKKDRNEETTVVEKESR